MAQSFKAKIYKVGINPCVKVPVRITNSMQAIKGFIYVRGTINKQPFQQTLVPIKGQGYRLYVNGLMLKSADVSVGDSVTFTLEQEDAPTKYDYTMPVLFKKRLSAEKLTDAFKSLTASRQKEILKYFNFIKTEETLQKNIEKVIRQLKGDDPRTTRIP